MEYIFGTIKRHGQMVDILKTVGEEHSDLKDNHTIVRKYPDSIITDTFNIVDHYLSDENVEKCYDWYEISNHYRYIDYFTPQKESLMPYTETKTAYIDDTEVIFTDVPAGNLSVYLSDTNGGFPSFTVERELDTIRVHFEPLEYVTKVTISIQ